MKKALLFCLLLVMLPVAAWSETSLWEVASGGQTLYLGGTCHVLRSTDYPLPEEFGQAYRDAGLVVFEVNPGKMNTPEVQQKVLAGAVYRDGRTLEKVLSPATYKALQAFCTDRGVPLQGLLRFKPSLVAVTLLALELQNRGVDAAGVEQYFYQRALADHKSIGALETVDQQVAFILGMGQGNENAFMAASLQDMERLDQVFDDLIAAWRKGDEAALEALTSGDIRAEFPAVYRTLFVDRNRAWLPAIKAYLRTPEKELILVGAGHLPGDDGLLKMLRDQGCRVRKVE